MNLDCLDKKSLTIHESPVGLDLNKKNECTPGHIFSKGTSYEIAIGYQWYRKKEIIFGDGPLIVL